MHAQLKVTSGPCSINRATWRDSDQPQPRRRTFIDEIHRLSPLVEEYLYSAMEDYKIDIVLDKGPSARSIQIELAPLL